MQQDDGFSGASMRPGDRVEVRSRFTESWAPGFELEGVDDDGYHVRRVSDGRVLPAAFAAEEVRTERS